MYKLKLALYKPSLILALAWVLLNFTIYPLRARSQSVALNSNSVTNSFSRSDTPSGQPDVDFGGDSRTDQITTAGGRLYFLPPDYTTPNATQNQDFDDVGRPPKRTSGGSRGLCSDQLIAIVPGSSEIVEATGNCSNDSNSSLALTLAESPTFWFYVPEQSTRELTVEFVLLNQNQQAVLVKSITLSGTPGIVRVRLNQPLQTDQLYRWQFSVLVNPQNPSGNPTVEGLVKRITADSTLSSKLNAATSPRDRIAIYASHGIWHDAMTALAQLRSQKPEDSRLERDWEDFLGSVGLRAIAVKPLVDCCIAK
ncbi:MULTISPECIES: DUF928 domain-containing protein [Moorena]|uniref:DUF928 domain-containing protein n=1 Tax=Moorena producens 3L TaxID=489825 RepID=F4XSP3_9CYAN|nr:MULTISPECIES: DUF928 domain-containing protein [Moorena]NEQ16509.1 DUF928 domain-containing protein [Moorena sp. SIO3E2]EGJ32368.1 protein of unknown function, DUF928 [Moorena producens 3L]NEP30968.1 DUF928 domain-containing protein [Moorena sp. SIO3B2]NEP68601.1 DUF928 domain-containing protein [Moorena sp. SIO3A5]NER91311.1 DUF928 domain-containing protein [Moorena sp. SIO3A2]